jgi:hypothetical protein
MDKHDILSPGLLAMRCEKEKKVTDERERLKSTL